MHFSWDPRLLNSVRGMKRNFVGDVMMWKEKGVLGFHSHDMSSELVTAPEGKVAVKSRAAHGQIRNKRFPSEWPVLQDGHLDPTETW